MSDNDHPKKYYTLNLTEGRIFIIFITFLIIFCVILFVIWLFIFNMSKKDKELLTQNTSENGYEYFTDTPKQSNINNDATPDMDPISQNNDYKTELMNENQNDSVPIENGETAETDEEQHSTNEKWVIDNQTKNENDKMTYTYVEKLLDVDDSQILYSSNHDNQSKKSSNTNKTTVQKNIPAPAKKTHTKSKEKKYKQRYIVQVGSYLDHKTAEDISIYYKIQGYPTFIKSKESNGKIYYRLRVGPFKAKNKAEEYLAALKNSKYGKSSYISIIYL